MDDPTWSLTSPFRSVHSCNTHKSVCCRSRPMHDLGMHQISSISTTVKIITGSLQGNLRIYAPRERDYKPEDLLLELELDQAILQLALGKFAG